ncbi:MAG: GNAT family N-acetyltransferase [Thermoplasmata archaeon]
MAGSGVSEKVEGFRFRRLSKPEEFRKVEEVEQAIAGTGTPASSLPVPLLRALQDNGGLVLGAFADIYLAGFTASLIGWDGTTLYHYCHLTAVRPEYQNHHLGFRLMAAQRDEVLKLGLKEVRWAFDPLQSRAAWLSVHRLGARPDRYYPHYFGQLPDAPNRGLETDRIRAVWSLTAAAVESRLSGAFPTAAEDRARWTGSTAIVETEPGESGIRVPTAVGEPTGASAHLEIPFDIDLVRQHEPTALRTWRHAVRDAFRAATDLGYAVDDFSVVSADHERRSFYFFSPAPPATAEPTPS